MGRKGLVATQTNFISASDQSRILLHAGDIASDGSFEKFQSMLLTNVLNLSVDKVDYHWGSSCNHLQVTRFLPQAPERFSLPLINGKPLDLHPPTTFQSPYFYSKFGSDKISITVGSAQRVLDFSE